MASPQKGSGQASGQPEAHRSSGKTTGKAAAQASSTRARPGKKKASRAVRRGRSRSLIGWIASLALTLTIIGIAGAGAGLYYITRDLPSLDKLRIPARPPSITVVSGDGEIMGRRGTVHAGVVRYEEMPGHLIQAVVAIEDQRFFEHIGIDFQGLVRAAIANHRAGRIVQGGSTLTQQLAKNLFLKPDRTYARKLQEMVLAIRLEQEFTKQEILELYLNRVYFGAGAWGIEAAAERYFEKSARDVTLSEAAILAGLLKAPSRYAPTTNKDRAVQRAQAVLDNMKAEGFVSEEETFVAGQMLRMPRAQAESFETAPYVLDYVAETLPEVIGEPQGDLVVETTLDLEAQRIAEETAARFIAENGEEKNVHQAGVVVMTNEGAVKALVGGLDYQDSQFNRAIKGLRQPGSTFKVFVYLAALEYGLTPWDVRVDQPVRIGDWEPHNYGDSYRGAVTIDEALTRSINTVAAQVADEIGTYAVIDVARRLGIEQELPNQPSLALGTGEVTLFELTGALANLASGGERVRPHVISRVLSPDGRVLYEHDPGRPVQVLTPIQVADMNLMLGHVISSGTGRRAQLGVHPAAGKTGTTQDYRDAWFIGYTGHYTAGVWVGNDDNSEMNRVTGGNLPAMIWKDTMMALHEGLEPIELRASQEPMAQPYDPRGSGFGSFFGSLFGFGPRQPQPVDPYARGDERFGYRYPGGAAYPPPGPYRPAAPGLPPFGQQLEQRRPDVTTTRARRERERESRPKTRLLLGGRPADSSR
jgi:penicillin-binding protein 1A